MFSVVVVVVGVVVAAVAAVARHVNISKHLFVTQ